MATTLPDFIVLRAFRPFLVYLTMYKAKNFRNENRLIVIRNICRVVVHLVMFSILYAVFVPAEVLVCYTNQFVLSKIADPMSYFLAVLPAIFVYILLFSKSDKIIETLDILHEIVVERKLVYVHFNLVIFSKELLVFHIGAAISQHILANYEQNEERFTRFTKTLIKTICCIITTTFSLTLLFPFSFIIFRYPPPEKWSLPFEYR